MSRLLQSQEQKQKLNPRQILEANIMQLNSGILEKRIASYRHWYKFLVFAKELEEQDAVLILKKKHHKIKVKKSM